MTRPIRCSRCKHPIKEHGDGFCECYNPNHTEPIPEGEQ